MLQLVHGIMFAKLILLDSIGLEPAQTMLKRILHRIRPDSGSHSADWYVPRWRWHCSAIVRQLHLYVAGPACLGITS